MATLYLCLGANIGPRVEVLLRASQSLALQLGASGLRASSVYADRDSSGRTGAMVNLLLRLDGVSQDEQTVQRALSATEANFGRLRDPERELPVALDVDWIGTLRRGHVEWNRRYDHGRDYVWLGLHELGDDAIAGELERIAQEREFDERDVRRVFYALMSVEFVRQLLHAPVMPAVAPAAAEVA